MTVHYIVSSSSNNQFMHRIFHLHCIPIVFLLILLLGFDSTSSFDSVLSVDLDCSVDSLCPLLLMITTNSLNL